jgi:hypothetical protein
MSSIHRPTFLAAFIAGTSICLATLGSAVFAADSDPAEQLQRLDNYPHAVQVDYSQSAVLDHEVGLGSIKKVRGVWQFKKSERLSGELTRYTWQIIDGFSSLEVMQELVSQVQKNLGVELLFECQGRACGQGAQWANRVFGQRILYGREDLQQYQAYGLSGVPEYRLVIYSAARTADRQYLHVELLQVEPAGD